MVIALETSEHVQVSYQKTANSNQISSAVQQHHDHSHYYRQFNHVSMCMPCDQTGGTP